MKTILFLLTLFLAQTLFAQKYNYPETPKIPVYDTIWGKVIQDDYRWMEDLKDPKVIEWLKTQSEFTNAQLAKIPGQDILFREMKKYDAMQSAEIFPVGKAGGKYFYQKRLPNEQTHKLYYRQGKNGAEILLFDPENHIPGKVFNFRPYPNVDGSILALNLSEAGSERGDVRFLDVASRKMLPDVLRHSTGSFAEGSKNEIVYTEFGTYDIQDFESRKNLPYMLHVLGTDQSTDMVLVSSKKNPELNIPEDSRPFVRFFKKSNYMILSIYTVDRNLTTYYALKSDYKNKKIDWKPLTKAKHQVKQIYVDGNDVFMLTSKGNPKFKIIKTSFLNPDLSKVKTIAEGEGDWLIPSDAILQTKNYLAFTKTKNEIVSKVFLYNLRTGKTTEVKTPLPGNIYTLSFGMDNKDEDEIILINSGWNVLFNFYAYNPAEGKISDNPMTVKYHYPDLSNIVYEEVEVPSHDGVLVPLSIIYDKTKLKKDGSNVAYMSGYGSYGNSGIPYFNPIELSLLERGMVRAIAHVRGGGEKGSDWHLAGKKTNKPNTWKDFNACAEYLIKHKYTSPEKLGITGASAGGILIGRAITERPDLYRVAIPKVGWLNTLRGEFAPNGPINIPEFGTIKIEEEFQALYEMDAFHHIQKGVKYPAQLITGGFNDSRVSIYFPGKFAAKMQDENGSDTPVFLHIDYAAGHYGGSTNDEQLKQRAMEYAFLLWQTGHPDFQPKNN